jgi:hypothetical protein
MLMKQNKKTKAFAFLLTIIIIAPSHHIIFFFFESTASETIPDQKKVFEKI